MSSSSKFSGVMAMISDFMIKFKFIFLICIITKLFGTYITFFLLFIKLNFFICYWYHFLFFVVNYLYCKLFKIFKTFQYNLFLYKNYACFLLHRTNRLSSTRKLKARVQLFFLYNIFQHYLRFFKT